MTKFDYRKYFSQKYLKEISTNHIKHFTISGTDKMNYSFYKKNEKKIIKSISDECIKGNYSFSNYKEKLILKDRDSLPRCISIPTIKDRIVLRTLLNIIEAKFADVPKIKIPHDHIKKIQIAMSRNDYDSYIKIDVEKFFNSVDHDTLFQILKEKIKSKRIIDLIKSAIENPTGSGEKNGKGLPQGVSISNILAHIYMSRFDKEYNTQSNFFYTRYVDDILIFCDHNELDYILGKITSDLNNFHQLNLNLSINKNKKATGLLKNVCRDEPLNYLGYSFFSNKKGKLITTINKKSVSKYEQRLVNLLNNIKKNPSTKIIKRMMYELNRTITGSITREVGFSALNKTKRYGWLLYFSQMNDLELLFRLDKLVQKKIGLIKKRYPKIQKMLEDNLEKQVKSFVTTYFEITYNFNETTYLFNPDSFNANQRREFLEETLGYPNSELRVKDDVEIEKVFYRNVYKKIHTEYRDLIEVLSVY